MAGTPIDELINTLYEMVEDAWSMPLGNDRCVLEREKVLDIWTKCAPICPAI